MESEAQTILESLESDVDRMRIDEALKDSMLARLDRLMGIAKQTELRCEMDIRPRGDKLLVIVGEKHA